MALLSRVLLLAVAIPFVLATSNSCSSDEFYYKDADCCVKNGGPPSPPPPPAGSSCPVNGPGWSWQSDKSCCVPHQANPPAPTCQSGWAYSSDKLCCEQNPPPSPPPPSNPPPSTGNCKSTEFYFSQKDCCVPYGGPPSPPAPPPGNSCPSNWSWKTEKSCCVPHQPNPPQPTCDNSWSWNGDDCACHPPPPTPPTPPPSHPSGYHSKRHTKKSRTLCPAGFDACPTSGLTTDDYQCFDFTELTSCGGCVSTGQGEDCSAIPGAWNVACEQNSCKISSCAQGFRLSADGKSCEQL